MPHILTLLAAVTHVDAFSVSDSGLGIVTGCVIRVAGHAVLSRHLHSKVSNTCLATRVNDSYEIFPWGTVRTQVGTDVSIMVTE